jgi:hypothetical protein
VSSATGRLRAPGCLQRSSPRSSPRAPTTYTRKPATGMTPPPARGRARFLLTRRRACRSTGGCDGPSCWCSFQS